MVSCTECGRLVPADFQFCGYCGSRLHVALSRGADAEIVDPSLARRRDERRMVAVLFADVSGFTAMSGRLDAEQVHAVMNEMFAGLGQAIAAEGGVIDKYIGDNVMALFGAPVAHEDDPVRACRAALGMQAFLSQFSQRMAANVGVDLKIRIGVNYGSVVAGGVGSDVKFQYTVMGDTVNVASRLETAAEPGAVLVSQSVQSRASRQFEFGPVRWLQLKGKPEPVAAYSCLRERETHGDDVSASTPWVGRDDARCSIMQWLDEPDTGWRWLDVRGQMGIGKSRLVHEAMSHRPDRLTVHVRPGGATARRPFGLIRRVLHESLAAHEGQRDGLATMAAFEEALVRLSPRLEPYRQALWFVSSPSLSAAEPPDPNPQSLRRTVERGVAEFLAALKSARRELVLVIDSYERADAASIQLLESLATQAVAAPPVISTSREDAASTPSSAQTLHLAELSAIDTHALLDALTHGATLPVSVAQDMLRRAGGVPLFLEEMVTTLRNSGALRRDETGDGWRFDPTAGVVTLPVNLQSAMVSRLDRLDAAARELLCQCAVQGYDFDLSIVDAVRRGGTVSGHSVLPLLTDLRQHRVLVPRDEQAGRWSFAHPLLQEACYETLLVRDRRELHAQTADAMCRLAGGRSRVSAPLLADHEEKAGRWMLAADANLRAGHDAAGLYLNDDALRRFSRVLELIGQIDATSADASASHIAAQALGAAAEVHLLTGVYERAREQAARMVALAPTPGDHAEGNRLLAEVDARTGRPEAALQRLSEVVRSTAADRCPDADAVSRAWHGLAELHHRANRLEEALDSVVRCRQTVCSDPSLNQIRADLLEGSIRHTCGEFDQAAGLYRRAFDAADEVGSLSQQARAVNSLGNIERDRGDYVAARRQYERALQLWQQMGDVECIAGAANNLGNVAMSVGDHVAAAGYYEQSSRTWRTIGNVRGAALGQANLAILALEQGDAAGAIEASRQAIHQLEGTGEKVLWGLAMVVLGEGCLARGDLTAARAAFERVLEQVTETDHRLAWAGAQRGLGHLHLERGELPAALNALQRAADAYQHLNRTQEEGRTLLLLAQVRQRMSMTSDARTLIERACAQFRSIGAQRDASRAEELLGSLER